MCTRGVYIRCVWSQASVALLGLSLGSTAPQFGVVVDSQHMAPCSGPTGLFTAIVLFAHVVETRKGGDVSGRSLYLLGLQDVIQPVPRMLHMLDRLFGLW